MVGNNKIIDRSQIPDKETDKFGSKAATVGDIRNQLVSDFPQRHFHLFIDRTGQVESEEEIGGGIG